MNPLQVTHELQSALVSYLLTTFDVNRDGKHPELAAALQRAFEKPGHLINGPYLELMPPYQRGSSLQALVDEGILNKRLLDLPSFKQNKPLPPQAHLYTHQETAIRRISGEGRSVVISSGTGSGKTESFLIPILNDLVTDKTPGVRALIIYPLNALVNDQLERLRQLLQGTEITFGLYTSELPETTKEALDKRQRGYPPNEIISREQIRAQKRLPQILITNYAMLEYLLLRPQDSILFDKGAWRFIVLDEAHTYSGVKGIEVAMLLRRLKLRTGKRPGEVRYIATSATLVNDDVGAAAEFARNLFGEDFTEEDIILGRIDKQALKPSDRSDFSPNPANYLGVELDEILQKDSLSLARILHEKGLLDGDDYSACCKDDTVEQILYKAMERNSHLRALRQWMLDSEEQGPVSVQTAADRLFSDDLQEPGDRQRALHTVIELSARARPASDAVPLLPARYHVFARAPQGVWVCLNPKCGGRSENLPANVPWSVLYPTPHQVCEYCEMAVYPLAVCRTCGLVYVYGSKQDELILSDDGESQPQTTVSRRYFLWSEVEPDASLADPDEDENHSAPKASSKEEITTETITLCLKCRRISRCTCSDSPKVKLYQVAKRVEEGQGAQKRMRIQPLDAIERCVRCGDTARIEGNEIVTPITAPGNIPISVITTELYRHLPASHDEQSRKKPGGGRKLLTFYDSRQGAARFASHLQDVFNQNLYRYIVLQALREKREFAPNLDTLSRECVEIGWELEVFQNDPELLYDERLSIRGEKQLDKNTREKLKERIQKRLLAEITINRKSRQSPEALGLFVVDYYEEGWPDLTDLATEVGMSAEQTQLLIRQLLDTVRQEKGVQLPKSISPDDTVFGQHKGYPALVRGEGSEGHILWFGKTDRHRRRRMVERVLKHLGRPAGASEVERVMMALWDWLVNESGILVTENGAKFRINFHRLYFSMPESGWYRCQKCQRFFHNAGSLPCPHVTCGGRLMPIDSLSQAQESNYYYHLLTKGIVPMRVEEHTAQLEPNKGQEYQNKFRSGDINLLSCSTTFEMGIDLGDLQAVMLNNVPPTIANYRQRAGRAGRRVGGTAFIVTWAQERPHDQLYFSTPEKIIRGAVRIPRIYLDNREIRRRHVNSLLLADFLRALAQDGAEILDKMGAFFDEQGVGGSHYSALSNWFTPDKAEQVKRFWKSLGYDGDAQQACEDFMQALRSESERYHAVKDQYVKAKERMIAEEDLDEAKRYQSLAKRLSGERLIDTLSNHGILPSYAFPLHTVELEIPYEQRDSAKLRLQRDLRQAIREYAPGAEIVADKRLWRSNGLRFLRGTPKHYHYKICSRCSFVEVAPAPGIVLDLMECPICSKPFGPKEDGWFVEPDGFSVDPKSGKSAGQYVNQPVVKMLSGLIVSQPLDWEGCGDPMMLYTSYVREGKLFYANQGEYGQGFKICLKCGIHIKEDKNPKACTNKVYGRVCGSTEFKSLSLGHIITTDTLYLRLESTASVQISPEDRTLHESVMYALLQGASRALQIERQDIAGLLHPVEMSQGSWSYSIVLYDSVPGGVGHVRDIRNNLLAVVKEAYQIVSSCECHRDTSCVHCLRDYHNQDVYPYLKRGVAEELLQALLSSLQGRSGIVAVNHKAWLIRQIQQAKHSLTIALPTIELQPIMAGLEDTWLDLFDDLMRRGVSITLLLEKMPAIAQTDHESLYLADWMRKLMRPGDGLKLFRLKHTPTWAVVIDAQGERPQAVRTPGDGLLAIVDVGRHQLRLEASNQPEYVKQAHNDLMNARGDEITRDYFAQSAGTKIYHVREGLMKSESQIPEIRGFFAQPVVEMVISDPYLLDCERLVKRAGAYIQLAQEGGVLKKVRIYTKDAKAINGSASHDEQNKAIETLKRRFSQLAVDIKRTPTEHDRYIEVTRANGSKARMWIGRGLDFIRPNGQTTKTYIVVEDPYQVHS